MPCYTGCFRNTLLKPLYASPTQYLFIYLVNYYRKNDYSSDRGKFDHLHEKYLTYYRDIVEGSI